MTKDALAMEEYLLARGIGFPQCPKCPERKERCIKGGIYPAFVASTIDQIAKEMLEGER